MADTKMDDLEMNFTADDTMEQGFNDDELQDIMSEIEDMEKEFATEDNSTTEMTLQEKIDAELAGIDTESEAMSDEVVTSNIVELPKAKEVPAKMTKTTEQVSFKASGQMNFNMEFKIGDESANLVVDPELGLIVEVGGVVMKINQETGCTFSMENGIKFTIPLNSSENSLKKKAA